MENDLIELIRRGGVFRDIPGNTPEEVLVAALKTIPIPAPLDSAVLLKALLEREALMSTAIGKGIALPHPRNALISDLKDQFMAIGYLRRDIDWKALDGNGVHSFLLIVSASPKLHLQTLSRVNFFCQREDFRTFLRNRASQDEIIKMIGDTEKEWK
ncbi:MAG: PTS sugar transporter subunit IIA [Treponema sp.]|jgi:PTS system nitrogen regulatory IIA component|nr:PTS sugar transporter subunit IIA [Treponema sp.]